MASYYDGGRGAALKISYSEMCTRPYFSNTLSNPVEHTPTCLRKMKLTGSGPVALHAYQEDRAVNGTSHVLVSPRPCLDAF